jgi:3-oxoadipate enol-lactonase
MSGGGGRPRDLPPGRPLHLPGRGTTFVHEAGDPDARHTFLLLHGWTVTAAVNWFPSITPLSTVGRVIALDHRGHGRGIRTRSRFRLADCADDAAAVCDHLGVERVIPVGYSMGGPIAQLTWLRHRRLVEGLVLCATSRNFAGRAPRDRAVAGMATGLSLAARATPGTVRRQLAERVLAVRYDDSPLGEWVRNELRGNDLRMVVEAGRAIGAFSSRDWIGRCNVPTAVVLTLHDLAVPPLRQRRLAAAIPGATIHPVDGGHDVCVTRPDRFVPVLVDAAASVGGRVDGQRAAS